MLKYREPRDLTVSLLVSMATFIYLNLLFIILGVTFTF